MSQYNPPPMGGSTNPYAGMNPYAAAPGTSLPACRGAAILQIVLGSLMALMAFCFGFMAYALAAGEIPADKTAELEQLASSAGMSIHSILIAMSIMVLIPAVLLVVLGIFVWRGSRACIMTSIVLVGLGELLVLMNLIGSLFSGNAGSVAAGACMMAVPLALMGMLMVMLVRGWRETGAIGQTAMDYQGQMQRYYQQYYQYQQQQQQTQQGIPQAPVPPPPPGAPGNPPPPPMQ